MRSFENYISLIFLILCFFLWEVLCVKEKKLITVAKQVSIKKNNDPIIFTHLYEE
jgi:hypothetical protein